MSSRGQLECVRHLFWKELTFFLRGHIYKDGNTEINFGFWKNLVLVVSFFLFKDQNLFMPNLNMSGEFWCVSIVAQNGP